MSIPQGPSNQPPGAYPPAGYPAGGPLPYQPPAPQKGSKKKVILIAVAVVALLVVGGVGAVAFLVKDKVKNITTIADPGCTKGKDVILADADLGGGTDPTVMKTKLQSLISGLDKAAAAAEHDDVKAAMTALSADYTALLKGLNTGQMPADLTTKVSTDANKIDELCTLGGAQK